MKQKTESFHQIIHITAKPEEIYEAFIDSNKHSQFTGYASTIDPIVGGKFFIMDGYIFGTNLKLSKGKRIIQEWKTTEWPKGYLSSIVDFSFKASKGGTELIFVHSRVPSEQAKEYTKGWHEYYWEPLKKYFSKK